MRTLPRSTILTLALSACLLPSAAIAENLKVTVYNADKQVCNFLFPLADNQGLDTPLSLRSGTDVPIAKATNVRLGAEQHTVPVGCRGEIRASWISPLPGGNGLRSLFVKTNFTYTEVTGSSTFVIAGESYDQPTVKLLTTRNERAIEQGVEEVIASDNPLRLVAKVTP